MCTPTHVYLWVHPLHACPSPTHMHPLHVCMSRVCPLHVSIPVSILHHPHASFPRISLPCASLHTPDIHVCRDTRVCPPLSPPQAVQEHIKRVTHHYSTALAMDLLLQSTEAVVLQMALKGLGSSTQNFNISTVGTPAPMGAPQKHCNAPKSIATPQEPPWWHHHIPSPELCKSTRGTQGKQKTQKKPFFTPNQRPQWRWCVTTAPRPRWCWQWVRRT